MKKSLIAVAVASAFAAPAAFADVTISGAINVGIAVVDSGDQKRISDLTRSVAAATKGDSRMSLAGNYSNVNISSVDDIGGGNKVILNIQFDLGDTMTKGGTKVGNRNTYLGFEGGWGSFKVGVNENVYERYAYEADPIDGAMGIGGNIQILGQSGFEDLDDSNWFDDDANNVAGQSFWRRTSQTLWFNSANYNGFTFEVDYTLPAGNTATLEPQVTSIGGQYKPEGMPFYVNVAYEKHTDIDSGLTAGALLGADAAGTKITGGYTFGSLLITAAYEMLEWEETVAAGTTKLEGDNIWFGAKWIMPTGYVGLELGLAQERDVNGATVKDSDMTMTSAGYFHNLSKQSQVYFVGTIIDNGDAAAFNIDAGGGSFLRLPGSKQTAFTVGMKHTF